MTNRSAYNAAPRKRGSLAIWFDPDMVWHAEKSGKRGRPRTFSDAAIRNCPDAQCAFRPSALPDGRIKQAAPISGSMASGLFPPPRHRLERHKSPFPDPERTLRLQLASHRQKGPRTIRIHLQNVEKRAGKFTVDPTRRRLGTSNEKAEYVGSSTRVAFPSVVHAESHP